MRAVRQTVLVNRKDKCWLATEIPPSVPLLQLDTALQKAQKHPICSCDGNHIKLLLFTMGMDWISDCMPESEFNDTILVL
jgi:hypothetical protein